VVYAVDTSVIYRVIVQPINGCQFHTSGITTWHARFGRCRLHALPALLAGVSTKTCDDAHSCGHTVHRPPMRLVTLSTGVLTDGPSIHTRIIRTTCSTVSAKTGAFRTTRPLL
jgi:hypothetical protein